jgi:hypothetical protein
MRQTKIRDLDAEKMQVIAYDEHEPSLTLSNGEVHKADVIIAADGEW